MEPTTDATETLESVQADTEATARRYAAMATLATAPVDDLAAWLNPNDLDLRITIIPAGDGIVVVATDDLDGHPVVSSIAVPAGSTPATFGIDADDRSSGVGVGEIAAELNGVWDRQVEAAAARQRLADLDAQRLADIDARGYGEEI